MLLYSISLALLLPLVTCSYDDFSVHQEGSVENKIESGAHTNQNNTESTSSSTSTGHIQSQRSKRAASSKVKRNRIRKSNQEKFETVPASYVQTSVEASYFTPKNSHLNRRQMSLDEDRSSERNVKLGASLALAFFFFIGLTVLFVHSYKNRKNRASFQKSTEDPSIFHHSVQKPEPVLDSDHNIQTKWRINSFLGVVSSVVAKLPKTRSMVSNVDHIPVTQQRQY